jgi:hypothetical protein
LRRIAHGAHQPMEAHAVELLASERGTLRGTLSAPPMLPATETGHHVGIHPIKLPVGTSGNSCPSREVRVSAIICFTSFPLCRLLVNSRTRSRSFFVSLGLATCKKCLRGFRWMLRFVRIAHPRNTKPPLPRRKSTNRVFAGCSVSPSRFRLQDVSF